MQFCWDLIRTCGFATCMSNPWTKWWRLLLQYSVFNSFPFFVMVHYKSSQYPLHLSAICTASVRYIAEVAGTFESLIWKKTAWNFLFSSLLPVPHTYTFQLLLFIHSELSLYFSFQFLISVLNFAFCFCFPFSLIAAKVSSDIHFFFFCDLTHPVVSLATSSRTVLSWYLSRDLLGLPYPVQPPMP